MFSRFFVSIIYLVQNVLYLVFDTYTLDCVGILGKVIFSLFTGHHVMVLCALVCLTVDRLISIKRPFFYQLLDSYFPMKCLGISLLFSASVFVVEFRTNKDVGFSVYLVIFISTAIFLSCANLYIRKMIKEQYRKINLTQVTSNDEQTRQIQFKLRRRQLRATRTCLFVIFSFVLLHVPVIFHFMLRNLLRSTYSDIVPLEVGMSLFIIAFLNSIVDGILYVKINKNVKAELKDVFLKWKPS